MPTRSFILVFIALFFMHLPQVAHAADGETTSAGLPERITRPMRATSPTILKAEGFNIRLWGIRTAETSETPLELKALDLMDGLIQDQQVNCRIVGGSVPELTARCTTQDNRDLALELLNGGYVVVDRQQTYNSVFASGYEKAQEAARGASRGIWRYVNSEETQVSAMPKWLKPHMDYILPLALVLGPFCGLLVVAFIMHINLRNIVTRKQQESEITQRKEAALATREKQVLAATLEGELTENKNKIEAFLAIYGDMLHTLQQGEEPPKYQQAGDIVQKHPVFGKSVYETNMARLSLLDVALAGHVSKLYASLPKEPEYINLEPNIPLETVIRLIEKIIHDTEMLLPAVEQTLKELQTSMQRPA
jgi:endonuclease YncB( thermonuclease family)